MTNQPRGRGLPARTSFAVTVVAAIAVVAIVGALVKIGLERSGTAAESGATPESVSAQATPGVGVGGGTRVSGPAAGPPASVQRLLTELKTRAANDPGDVEALTGLAQMYAAAGKSGEALPYFRRALALRPGDAQVRTEYADALHRSGDDAGARRELEAVLRAQPDYEPARAGLRTIGG